MTPSGLRTAQDLLPEAALLVAAVACALAGRLRAGEAAVRWLAALGLVAAGLLPLVYLRGMPDAGYPAYSNGLVVDRYTVFLTPALCAVGLLAVGAADRLPSRVRPHHGEVHALLLLATLGAVLCVAAAELAELFVAVELLGMTTTLLVAAVKTERPAVAAAARLLVAGGAASAVLLFGMALLYGLAGSTVMADIAARLGHTSPALALAAALVVLGVVGRLLVVALPGIAEDLGGAVPPLAGAAAGLGIVAALGTLGRLLVVALPGASSTWTAVVAVVAVVATVVGALAAVGEREPRRLLRGLAGTQCGVLLVGLLAWRQDQGGIGAMVAGAVVTAVAVVAADAALAAADVPRGARLDDLRGLARRAPVAAAVLGIAALSLAGAPPLGGFLVRLLVLEVAAAAGWAWLLPVMLGGTVVAILGAARLAAALLGDGAEDEPAVATSAASRVALGAGAAVVVLTAVAGQPLLALAVGGAGQLH